MSHSGDPFPLGLRPMDFRLLKYFLAVAEESAFGPAARRLGISEAQLIRQIKTIEAELGTTLLVRRGRSLELTPAGSQFMREADNIGMLVRSAVDRVQRAGEGKLGRIDIGIYGSAIYDLIPKLLQDFRARTPGVQIALHTMDKREQIDALRQQRITLAFNRIAPVLRDIGHELVATERLFLVLPDDHPLAALDAVPFRELKHYPLVLFPTVGRPNFIDRVIDLCKQQGFRPTIDQEVGDAVTGMALVAKGFGITLVAESAAVALRVRGTTYRPFADAPQAVVDLSCLYRLTDQSPLLQSFLAVIRAHRAAQGSGTVQADAPLRG